jgi:PAS domain S-box-containing protein
MKRKKGSVSLENKIKDMKLRLILLVLSLLTFLSASTGGYFYYSSLKKSAFQEVERQAATHAEMIKKNLSSFLSENIRPSKTLAGMDEFRAVLTKPNDTSIAKANAMLDHFNASLKTDVCYLMDTNGNTIASSNRRDPDSFIGDNFSFRPYFQKAIQGTPATYLALGVTSDKRGVYYSHPVNKNGQKHPMGVVVIKASIGRVEKRLPPPTEEIVLVVNPDGIIFISNYKKWLFHALWKLLPEKVSRISASLQFGKGPWNWIGLEMKGDNYTRDLQGNRYLMQRLPLNNYPGWSVVYLRNLKAVSKIVSGPLIKITGPIVLTLCVLVGFAVFLLYKKASDEIVQRKLFERALGESEKRYRSIYHNTPAMLHSVDAKGRLISVSDNWLEVMGYERQEVVGQKLTRFFTENSRNLAETTVFPAFFKTGICKDIPYQFVKKNGEIIDVMLSAIGDRDNKGNITRSLAVSIDVTERNQAEEALKIAKEELSRHSKDLEWQVEQRTKEISSILDQLRRLSGSMMTNQEKERSAIARELHDELGQILTALRMDSVWLRSRLKQTDAEAAQRVSLMCELIDKTIEEVRGLALRLRPGVLDNLGLVDALEWFTADFERRTGITCVFEHGNIPHIADTVATAVYRIAQETLTNVARHAFAGRVEVVLQNERHILKLTVIDNGRGFITSKVSEAEALGLVGMRERATLVRGVLDVQSSVGKGTRVNLKVPIDGHGRGVT